jgi:DNA-damage-inducible protein J
MTKTATVRARIKPDLKERAERVLRDLGLNPTQAITLFYRQVELHQGLPFELVVPTDQTRQTFEDTEAGRNLIVCKDVDDMFEKLHI